MTVAGVVANVALVGTLLGATVVADWRWRAWHVGYGTWGSAVLATVAVVVTASVAVFYPVFGGWAGPWLAGLVLTVVVASLVVNVVTDRMVLRAWLRHTHGGPN